MLLALLAHHHFNPVHHSFWGSCQHTRQHRRGLICGNVCLFLVDVSHLTEYIAASELAVKLMSMYAETKTCIWCTCCRWFDWYPAAAAALITGCYALLAGCALIVAPKTVLGEAAAASTGTRLVAATLKQECLRLACLHMLRCTSLCVEQQLISVAAALEL